MQLSQRKRRSITSRLMFWGLILLGSALLLNTVAGLFYTRKQIYTATGRLQRQTATSMAGRIRASIERKLERLEDTARGMSLQSTAGAEGKVVALWLLKSDRTFAEISILNPSGAEVAKASEGRISGREDLRDQSRSEAFIEAKAGSTYIGSVENLENREPYITLAVPLHFDGKFSGVLTARTSLSLLWDFVIRNAISGRTSAYLIDESGRVIATHDGPSLFTAAATAKLGAVGRFLVSPSEDPMPGDEGIGLTGERVLSTYAPVPQSSWAVVVEEPAGLALADVERLNRDAVIVLVVGLLFGGAMLLWISRKITEPIQDLSAGARMIASGNLEHRVTIRTGDEIEELANEFNGMTEALQQSRATLEQQVRQRTREVSALYEVSTAVHKSLDLRSILNEVIAKTTAIFSFQAARIFLWNESAGELEIRASFENQPNSFAGSRTFKLGQGMVGLVAQSGEPLIFEDVWTDSRYAELSPTKRLQVSDRHFFAAFPIKAQSTVCGVLVFHGDSPRKLTTDESRLLVSMTEHLAVAIEKANLFEQVRSRSQHLAVLNSITAAVTHSLDFESVLDRAVKEIVGKFSFDACWIYIVDERRGSLCLKAHQGLPADALKGMETRPLTGSLSSRVFETRSRLIFEDLQTNALYARISDKKKLASLGYRASAGFPIEGGNRINGVLHVAVRARHHFAVDELQLLESVAQSIGVAVENARLFAEVKEKTSELAKANEELRGATRAKSEFIAAMSHELRTPLHIIIGHSDLTRDGTFGTVTTQQQNVMRKIARNARVLLKMVENVLTLSRLDAKKMSLELETVVITDVLEEVQTHIEHINRDHHLDVVWRVDERITPVVTDPIKLEEILQNLIGNAFKFTREGQIAVEVRDLPDQRRVQFIVSDTGIGIQAANLERIFEDFEQVDANHGDENHRGAGLGLSIVRKYLDLMCGAIHVESEPEQGTRFTFWIPYCPPSEA